MSLALIGNVSPQNLEAKRQNPSRDVFDKEARRKALVFAADAYGDSMCFRLRGMPGRRAWKCGKTLGEDMEPRMRCQERVRDCRFYPPVGSRTEA